MNKLIKDQLNKCRVAQIPIITDDTNTIIINKVDSSTVNAQLMLNSCYLIKIADNYIKTDKYKTVTDNWNKGIGLNSNYYKVAITQFLSDMVKVDAVRYNIDTNCDTNDVLFAYWLPVSVIEIIKVIR